MLRSKEKNACQKKKKKKVSFISLKKKRKKKRKARKRKKWGIFCSETAVFVLEAGMTLARQ